MNKQQLANKIWESANKMRSKIEANEYKDYILGFIFYKYLSDQEVKFLKENDFAEDDIKAVSEEDPETVEYIQQNIGYFIAYENLFSTWLEMGRDFDVSNVRDALSAFSRLIHNSHKKVFENIFRTLETGLSKLGDSSGTQTKAISGLLQLIKEIPMDGKQDYDVLGFIYEYLIEKFAANAGKKAGEFYTPQQVSKILAKIVTVGKERLRNVYDPTCGSGSLLLRVAKEAKVSKFYGQELTSTTYNLARMNMLLHDVDYTNFDIKNDNTVENPQHLGMKFEAIVANPPYSANWSADAKFLDDERFSAYGKLAPKSKADFAFIQHMIHQLDDNGTMAVVLPHGVLFRGAAEGVIRKYLIEERNVLDAVIGLPANIFFGTSIPTVILVFKKNRENNDILFIDASNEFEKGKNQNNLTDENVEKIVNTYVNRETIEKYSYVASMEEIKENDYNLNIPRYVDTFEEEEPIDLVAVSERISSIDKEIAKLDEELAVYLRELGL